MRWLWIAAAVLFVAVALTALVSCGRQQPATTTLDSATRDRVTTALKIAQRRWGVVCNGKITVRRGDLPPRSLARASYRFAAGTESDARGFYDCAITVRGGRVSNVRFCIAISHEVGHLAGYRAVPGQEFVRPDGSRDAYHSRSKNSLMYPRIKRIVPACRGRGPA